MSEAMQAWVGFGLVLPWRKYDQELTDMFELPEILDPVGFCENAPEHHRYRGITFFPYSVDDRTEADTVLALATDTVCEFSMTEPTRPVSFENPRMVFVPLIQDLPGRLMANWVFYSSLSREG